MTSVMQAFRNTVNSLETAGVTDAYFEARLLVKHSLGIHTTELYSDSNRLVAPQELATLKDCISRRLSGEPGAYITGVREFFGLNFFVDNRVLIPRPETELVVEKALEYASKKGRLVIADIGTGSGAIAVSIAVNLPSSYIYAIDSSAGAIEVGIINARRHHVTSNILFVKGDFAESIPEPVSLLVANLPYIPESQIGLLPREVARYEPYQALNGGHDGLALYRRLLIKMSDILLPGGCAVLEIGWNQARGMRQLIQEHLPTATAEYFTDLNGITRVIRINL